MKRDKSIAVEEYNEYAVKLFADMNDRVVGEVKRERNRMAFEKAMSRKGSMREKFMLDILFCMMDEVEVGRGNMIKEAQELANKYLATV